MCARARTGVWTGGRFPARAIDLEDVERTLEGIPRERDVILYCACPNEASAAQVALKLRDRGFAHVRPLAGGIDAWVSAGLAVDTITAR